MAAASALSATKKEFVVSKASLQPRTLDLTNKGTLRNNENRVVTSLCGSDPIAARILQCLDFLSVARFSLTCKHWHILRTSDSISKWLINAHFNVSYAPPQIAQTMVGAYWNRYREFGESYQNARTYAFQRLMSIDFSKPSKPLRNVLSPQLVGNFPRFSMRVSDGFSVDAVCSAYTTVDIVDPVTQTTTSTHHSRVQIRTSANECYFEGDHVGKVSALTTSQFAPLIAAGMEDGTLVLWDIVDGKKKGILPFQPVDMPPSDQPTDSTHNLPPLTSALQWISFLDATRMRVGHQDGTMCLWSWDDTLKMEFKREATRRPHFQLIKAIENDQTQAVYGRFRSKPYHFCIFTMDSKLGASPKPIDIGERPLQAITFLSKTTLACAFPIENNRACVRVLDLNTETWTTLIPQMLAITHFDPRFNNKVLAISSYEVYRQTQKIQSYITLYDLQKNEFVCYGERKSIYFEIVPSSGINDSSLLVSTPPQNPTVLTVVERVSKRVFFYDFMSFASELRFSPRYEAAAGSGGEALTANSSHPTAKGANRASHHAVKLGAAVTGREALAYYALTPTSAAAAAGMAYASNASAAGSGGWAVTGHPNIPTSGQATGALNAELTAVKAES